MKFLTGNELRERIGLQFFAEDGGAEGANEQEAAEPAPETGANEQEAAEPAQSAEQNAGFAAARRRAEAEMQKRAQTEKDELVRQMLDGQTNPYTGKPITTEAEYRDYLKRFEQEQQTQQLQQAGISAETLNRLIEQNPTVQQAREVVSRVQKEEGQRALDAQIAEIGQLDPSVKDFKSLTEHPNFEQFNELALRGYNLVDAFKLANFQQLTGKKAAAARQAALNNVNGKNHLGVTRGADNGEDIVVTDEEMAMMKHAFPNATRAQLIEKFKKYR